MNRVSRVEADPLDRLRERTSAKWRAYPPEVLPLPVAEMDYPLAEPIAHALEAAIRRSDTGYLAGSREVGEALASFAERRLGWRIDPERVTTTGDVSMAIVELLRAVTAPGDRVVVTPPIYPPFFELPREAGRAIAEVPMLGGIDEGWRLDLEGIGAAFATGATAIVLCNPHNPIGCNPPASDLAALAELAAAHGATVVSDEVHGPLSQPNSPYTPFLTVSDAAREHGIAVTAASKAFNVAGLKCACMVSASGRIDRIVAGLPYEVPWRTSQFGAIASVAAFREGDRWLDGVIASLDDSRRLLGELLAEELPGVRYRMPEAGYLAWLDLSALGWGDDPAAYALEHARVALGVGPEFGAATGRGHARLNFACSPELLREAVSRLAGAR